MKSIFLLLTLIVSVSSVSLEIPEYILGFKDCEWSTGSRLRYNNGNSMNCTNDWKVWKFDGPFEYKDDLRKYGVQTKGLKAGTTRLDFNGELWISTGYGPIEWPQKVYNQLVKLFGSDREGDTREGRFDPPSFECQKTYPTIKIELASKTVIELKKDDYIRKSMPYGDCYLKGEIGRNNSRLLLPRSFLASKCLRYDADKSEMALSDRI